MIKETSEPLNLEKLQSGDADELTKMVNLHTDQIYRVALRMLNNETEAEDVLQETFIKALNSIGNFEGRSNLSTWLYRIAVNESLMHIRKRKPEVPVIHDDEDEDAEGISVSQIVDWCCLPESEFMSSETREILDDAIHNLPENLRSVFILRDIEGLSIAETAQTLDLTETNVKTRLLRARMKLREELSVYFSDRLPEN
jgi:RNA polymerase sigma-70 factor (ECF subfamily)